MFKNIRTGGDEPFALCSASYTHPGPAQPTFSVKRAARRGVLCTALALAAALTGVAASADAATLLVDKDSRQCPNADYATISAAVADAGRGDRIDVCPSRRRSDR